MLKFFLKSSVSFIRARNCLLLNKTTVMRIKEMESLKRKNVEAKLCLDRKNKLPRRKRSMTTLNLQWVGERVRKARKIKEAIANGTYNVDSKDVASSLIGLNAISKGSDKKLI